MESIVITSEDASQIALAIIADKHHGQDIVQVSSLQSEWRQLGLRVDDLVQGLTLLAREQLLSIEGDGENAAFTLPDSTLADLAPQGAGIKSLNKHLQQTLKLAAQRASENSDSDTANTERRDGFS